METRRIRVSPSGPFEELLLATTTDDIENVSDVPGETATDALNELNERVPPEVWVCFPDAEDAYPALQAIIDAHPDGCTINLSCPGTPLLSHPVRLFNGHRLIGLGPSASGWLPTFRGGDCFLLSLDHGSIDHGAALTGADDYSLRFEYDPDVETWLNLSHAGLRPTEPLTEFCFEFDVSFHTSFTAEANAMYYWGGIRGDLTDKDIASFAVSASAAGNQIACVIGGVYFQFAAAWVPSLNTTYRLTFDYKDGDGEILFFVDGVEVASHAATGTFYPPAHQEFYLGYAYALPAWEGGPYTSNPNFDQGAFRFSRISRHRANYTPAALTSDGDSLLFFQPLDENEEGDLYKMQIGIESNGDAFCQARRGSQNTTADCSIEECTIYDPTNIRGICAVSAYGMIRARLNHVHASNTGYGARLWNNCYLAEVIDCKFLGGLLELTGARGAHGLVLSKAANLTTFEGNMQVQGYDYNVVCVGSDVAGAGFLYGVEAFTGNLTLVFPKNTNLPSVALSDEGAVICEYGLLYVPEGGFAHQCRVGGRLETSFDADQVPVRVADTTGNPDSRLVLSLSFQPHADTEQLIEFTSEPTSAPVVIEKPLVSGVALPVSLATPKLLTRFDSSPTADAEFPGPAAIRRLSQRLWLRSDYVLNDADEPCKNGQVATTWLDLSGHGFNATAKGVSPTGPIFRAADSTYKLRPSLTFDGAADAMENLVDQLLTTPGAACTVFIVANSANGTGGPIFAIQSSSKWLGHLWFQPGSSSPYIAGNGSDGSMNYQIAIPGTPTEAFWGRWTWAAAGASDLEFFYNGELQANTAGTGRILETGNAGFNIGWNASNGFFPGSILEICVWEGVELTDAEAQMLAEYVTHTYGI